MLNLVNFGFVVWTKIGELHEPASTSNACPRDVRVTRCDMSAPETEPEVRTREDLNKFLRARTREGSPVLADLDWLLRWGFEFGIQSGRELLAGGPLGFARNGVQG